MIEKAMILGAIQGATEFLPVSSSAHLVITQHILGLGWGGAEAAAFDVALHLGTALAVILALWDDIKSILRGLFKKRDEGVLSPGYKTFGFIILATIPAVVVALLYKSRIEELFVSPRVAGYALIVTGLILLLTKWLSGGHTTIRKSRFWQAILIGCAQAFAIIPGISRSGSTISTGLFLKWDRTLAAKFSFLMSLPAIFGAAILEYPHLKEASFSLTSLAVGFLAALLVGYICVKWMISLVSRARLWMFAPYCFVVGVLVIIFIK